MSHKEQLLSRACMSVRRILLATKRKTPVSKRTADAAVGPLTARLVKNGAISMRNGRVSIAPEAREETCKTARSLGWMEDPQHHHGQQAGECAAKTLRALWKGTINGERLLNLCAEFGRLRKRHIDRKSAKRPRANAREIQLPEHGVVARWLTAEVDLDRVGHAMRNCLANESFAKSYKRRLRKREIELVALSGNGVPVVLICADADTRAVESVEGPSNERPISYRAAIIATLAEGAFHVGEHHDCLQIAVCDEILDAYRTGTVRCFSLLKRECEIGEGFIVITRGADTVLLRSKEWASDMYVAHIGGSDSEWVQQSATRNWLRKACLQNAEFAQACHDAFRDAHKAIRQDWFGVTRTTTS